MTTDIRQDGRMPVVWMRLAVASLLALTRPPGLYAEAPSQRQPQPPPVSRPTESPPGLRPPTVAIHTPAAQVTVYLPTPPALEQAAVRRQALNQFLFRDRRHRLLLTRSQHALSAGDTRGALPQLQAIINADQDAFIWSDTLAIPQGAQVTALQRLQSLSPLQRARYELVHGDEAHSLLKTAASTSPQTARIQVIQRFPHTDAGRKALFIELLMARDSGHARLAKQLARRLRQDEYHWNLLSNPRQAIVARLLVSARRRCNVRCRFPECDLMPPGLATLLATLVVRRPRGQSLRHKNFTSDERHSGDGPRLGVGTPSARTDADDRPIKRR